MVEYWTIQQAAANAELFAEEFSNRQILLYGLGEPILQAPLGVEYEDRTFMPPKRFRKVGEAATDWLEIKIIQAATEEEINNGVNDSKMITPMSLSNRLNDYAEEILGIPKNTIGTNSTNSVELTATDSSINAAFELNLPEKISLSVLPIIVKGYGSNSTLENIIGGSVGQIVTIRKGENTPLTIASTDNIKVSASITLADTNHFDNITLQRLSENIWGELTRKQFT